MEVGEVVVKGCFYSLDPYLRGGMGLPGDEPSPSKRPNLTQFRDSDGMGKREGRKGEGREEEGWKESNFSTAIIAIGEKYGGRAAGVVVKSKNPKVEPGRN